MLLNILFVFDLFFQYYDLANNDRQEVYYYVGLEREAVITGV